MPNLTNMSSTHCHIPLQGAWGLIGGDVPGPPLQWEEPEDISNPEAGYGFVSDNEEENDIFFFHTDHLGSTAYMTNKNGETCQFISYMPYGEAIIDEHNTDYENPFKFTGMELDPITGLYDHGARQRDPIHLNWLNPDPLTEKYPMYSAYSYCNSNPMRFIDPTGMEGEWWRTVWNTIKDPDGLEGRADPANTGEVTKQDVIVGTAVIGTITGGAALLVEGTSVVTSVAIVNSIDDIGTNMKGESLSQQLVKNDTGKNVIGKIKTGINILSVTESGVSIYRTNDAIEKAVETTNIINTMTNELTNHIKNEE
ncbi:MAG: hypothetical protein E7076_01125 [Bacteroidales bacterium]|nr:hypothetical protein [Bacteroidales bacterium]